MAAPVIPEYITVHLGAPDDASAPNVRVPFIDYIKNVASSEIFPTWPESALRANILAEISFALNRIYTEWYPSRGYNFDITSDTRYDQKFIPDREIFTNISDIVDDTFDDYIVRQGNIQPLFAQYCSGTTVTCPGLSQWGTVPLAEQGMVPYEILQHYYGDDINIIFNAPTGPNLPSYPGTLRRGEAYEEVYSIQRQLNRIARNYPAIGGPITQDGIYGVETEAAVRNFQRIFNLNPDGIVGRATWYKIKSIYNAVKNLGELVSEGLTYEEARAQFPGPVALGEQDIRVRIIQYYLGFLADFDDNLSSVNITGTYDVQTENAVRIFQSQRGLPVTGEVDGPTFDAIVASYQMMVQSLPVNTQEASDEIFPGYYVTPGETDPRVAALQRLLIRARRNAPYIPLVTETGTFDDATTAAVLAVQRAAGLPENSVPGPVVWSFIADLARS